MREGANISDFLHINEANESELRWLLHDFFRAAFYDDSEVGIVYYPNRSNASVKLAYCDGSLVEVIAGPNLTAADLEELQRRVNSELLAPSLGRIGKDIYLSEKAVAGYFRHHDVFQILPAPVDAPTPDPGLPGLYPRHPFLLEYLFDSSPHPVLNGLRRLRKRFELELILSALLDGSILCTSSTGGRYHWVFVLRQSSQEGPRCSFLQEGYVYKDFPSESNEFSQPAGFIELRGVESGEYYNLTWGPAMSLALPMDFAVQLNRFNDLPSDKRERLLRACHWLRQSSAAVWNSRSAAFVALAVAVEALVPRTRAGRRKSFEALIDRYAPERGLEEDRKRFYKIRSELAHGAELRYEDRDPLQVSITPRMSEDFREFESMRRVAKLVIVNWLAASSWRS